MITMNKTSLKWAKVTPSYGIYRDDGIQKDHEVHANWLKSKLNIINP